MTETGISNGAMMVRPIMSHTVTTAIPSRHTQGRLERKSSPRNMDTRLGTIRPRNGNMPTTTVTTPEAMAARPTPSSTTRS